MKDDPIGEIQGEDAQATLDSLAASERSRRVSVRLSNKDWRDLVYFVRTDLYCMDPEDPTRAQMERILGTIRKRVDASENEGDQP